MTTSSKEFNQIRATFMQRASARGVSATACKLAYLITFKYMNTTARLAFVAQETLAADLETSVRTVQRLLNVLEPLGLAIELGNGRGKASTYRIEATSEAERVTPTSSFSTPKRVTSEASKGRQTASEKGDTGVAPTLLKRTNKRMGDANASPHPRGERERASRDEISPPPGPPPLTRLPGEDGLPIDTERPSARLEEERRDQERPAVETAGTATVGREAKAEQVEAREEAWRDLRALWRRGHACDDTPKAIAMARQAYARACEDAEPDEIIKGARAWVAAADAPRFLPALPGWLAARSWETPPPTKAPRAYGGAPHGTGGRYYGRKPSMAAAALRVAEQYAAELAEQELERGGVS
jgi:hypothetical protein